MRGCSPEPVRRHLCFEHLSSGKTKSWQFHSGGSVVAKNQGLFCSGSLPLPRDDHFNNPMLGVPLYLKSSLGIDFQRATAVRVSHEFLHDLGRRGLMRPTFYYVTGMGNGALGRIAAHSVLGIPTHNPTHKKYVLYDFRVLWQSPRSCMLL